MLRPEEVVGLRLQDCQLAEQGWGKLILEKTDPAPGKGWTDDGEVHESRGLSTAPASPYAPYPSRHAGVTVRLYAGVPAKQVAKWAGHSVEVLHRTYSKVLDGFDETWFERIDKVLGNDEHPEDAGDPRAGED